MRVDRRRTEPDQEASTRSGIRPGRGIASRPVTRSIPDAILPPSHPRIDELRSRCVGGGKKGRSDSASWPLAMTIEFVVNDRLHDFDVDFDPGAMRAASPASPRARHRAANRSASQ